MAEWPCCHDPLRFSPLSLRFDPPPFPFIVPPQNVKNKKPKKNSKFIRKCCARFQFFTWWKSLSHQNFSMIFFVLNKRNDFIQPRTDHAWLYSPRKLEPSALLVHGQSLEIPEGFKDCPDLKISSPRVISTTNSTSSGKDLIQQKDWFIDPTDGQSMKTLANR